LVTQHFAGALLRATEDSASRLVQPAEKVLTQFEADRFRVQPLGCGLYRSLPRKLSLNSKLHQYRKNFFRKFCA
jgi:hypothetical protein